MELALSLFLGIGLSAATGFRVFVPALVASAAALAGWITPTSGFEFLATWPAFALLATASAVELAAYYIPWVDNALDTIAGPGAVVAGGLIATSFLEVDSPVLQWGLGMMAGGATAGVVQAGTTLLRGASTATTGGLGNPVLATLENVGSVALSALSILLPAVAAVAVLALFVWLWRRWSRFRESRRARAVH